MSYETARVNTVSKGVLKAKMLAYFRQVQETGQALIVTDNRVPVLKIIPFTQTKNIDDVFPKRNQVSTTLSLDEEAIFESLEDEWYGE